MKKRIIGTFLCISLVTVMATSAWAGYDAGVKAYRQGNYATALHEFMADGSAPAHFYLSLMYEKGDGVPQSREEAVAFLRLAAEQGLDVAQANLGILYFQGMVVNKDMTEGAKWLRKAAEQGLPEAQAALGLASDEKSRAAGRIRPILDVDSLASEH
jgi:TPR repeat protein